MKIVFAVIAVLFAMATVVTLQVSKSAVHEILAAVLALNFIGSIATFALLNEMGKE